MIMAIYASDIQNPINLLDPSELTADLEKLGDSLYYSATVSATPSDINPPTHKLYFILPLNEKYGSFTDSSFDSKIGFLGTYNTIKSEQEKRLIVNPEEIKTSKASVIYERELDAVEREFQEHKVQAGAINLLCNICAKIYPAKADDFTVRKGINNTYLPVFIEEILRQDTEKHTLTNVRDFILNNDPPYRISAYEAGLKPDQIIPLKI